MKELWDRVWSYNPRVVDGVIAAFIVVTSIGDLVSSHFVDRGAPAREVDILAVLLVVVGGGAITLRRERPLQVLLVVFGCAYVFFALGYSSGNNLDGATLIAAYTVASRADPRWLRAAGAAGVPFIPLSFLHASGPNFGQAVSQAVTVLVAAVVGHNIRLRRENREQVEITEQVTADKAVTDERLRIARELHDVVAHAMSVVTVQSGVAAHVIDTQPDEAKRMLENIRSTSHEALDEMRRLLGVLRGSADLAPAPTLLDVDELAQSLRDSGVPVRVEVSGDRHDIPGGVDLTGYRIIQEALTNVLKHAGAASVVVQVSYAPGLVIVEVVDDGRGDSGATTGGHGLLGMRERVAVFGGDLVNGPASGGGYRVRATLPYAT
jgi:signal transduction histidine kinase